MRGLPRVASNGLSIAPYRRRQLCSLKLPALLIAAALACPKFAEAQTTIKIGVLTDMSGLYADFSGQGSVESAKMAAEDFMAPWACIRPRRPSGCFTKGAAQGRRLRCLGEPLPRADYRCARDPRNRPRGPQDPSRRYRGGDGTTLHRRRASRRGHDRGPPSDRRAMRAFQTIAQKFIPPA
jgi:hypothetical protein